MLGQTAAEPTPSLSPVGIARAPHPRSFPPSLPPTAPPSLRTARTPPLAAASRGSRGPQLPVPRARALLPRGSQPRRAAPRMLMAGPPPAAHNAGQGRGRGTGEGAGAGPGAGGPGPGASPPAPRNADARAAGPPPAAAAAARSAAARPGLLLSTCCLH